MNTPQKSKLSVFILPLILIIYIAFTLQYIQHIFICVRIHIVVAYST